jgi:hypothetical protein
MTGVITVVITRSKTRGTRPNPNTATVGERLRSGPGTGRRTATDRDRLRRAARRRRAIEGRDKLGLVSRGLWIVVLVAGCGGGYRRVRDTDEMPVGTCSSQVLAAGESCIRSRRDYSIGTTVIVPQSNPGELGGQAWVRWPLFHAGLDERRVRRGELHHHSLAGAVGTQIRPTIFWPRIQRYFDPGIIGGFDLGIIKESRRVRGRGDGYFGFVLDLYAPDFGPFKYLQNGVPGVRLGVRHTAFVEGWEGDTTFDIGLIWRWGVPIDLLTRWTYRRSGD